MRAEDRFDRVNRVDRVDRAHGRSGAARLCAPRRATRLALALIVFCGPAHADAQAFDATAVHPLAPGVTYRVSGQPNRLAAAGGALQRCRDAARSAPELCEVASLAGRDLTTSDELEAAGPRDARPLYLWRFDGPEATVWVAGSIHLLKPGFYPLPPPIVSAFDASDTLVLEVDVTRLDPAAIGQIVERFARLPNGQTLSGVLPADVHRELTATLAEYGIAATQFEPYKPAFVAQQLALLGLASLGYSGTTGLESHFRARAPDRPVLELESLEFQLDVLFGPPLKTQIAMLRDTLEQMDEIPDLTDEMILAWLSGDDKRLREATQTQAGTAPEVRAYMKTVLDDRNTGMSERIVELLGGEGRYFVLIGAAHLVGRHSVIAQLERAGFRAERSVWRPAPAGAQ